MRLKLALVFCLCAGIGIMAGCGSDPVFPEEPAMVTGSTDGDGVAVVTGGPYEIEITVVNTVGTPVSGASVACYLLHEHLLAIASFTNGTYYPGIVVADLEDAQRRHSVGGGGGPEIVGTARTARETPVTVEIVVESASHGSHGYDSDPENYDMIESDDWTTETTEVMDMPTFYAYMDTIDYQNSVFVHLTPEISNAAGSGRQLASFLMGQLGTFEIFASLMSWELRLFAGDTVTVTTMTYMENNLPLMNISGLSMYRDFFVQFTLTWGVDPRDLDSHLFTPPIPGEFDTLSHHVYYANRGSQTEPPYADLDVDDVSSFGPEHVTIWDEFPGNYIYAVYHYSGSGTIATSEAEVGVLRPDGQVQNFSVPDDVTAGDNYWWHVCNVDGETGVVTVVDTIAASSPGVLSFGGPTAMPAKSGR